MPLCKPARKRSNAASRISKARPAAMTEEATRGAYGGRGTTPGGATGPGGELARRRR